MLMNLLRRKRMAVTKKMVTKIQLRMMLKITLFLKLTNKMVQ